MSLDRNAWVRVLGLVILVALVALLFAGCPQSDSDPADFVGTWTGSNGAEYSITEDLRVLITAGDSRDGPYQATFDGGALTLDTGGLSTTRWTIEDIETYLGDYAFAATMKFRVGRSGVLKQTITIDTRGGSSSRHETLERTGDPLPILAEGDDGGTLEIAVGGGFLVELPGDYDSGYEWQVLENGVVTQVGDSWWWVADEEPDRDDASRKITKILAFEVLDSGSGELTLESRSVRGDDRPAEGTWRITVVAK